MSDVKMPVKLVSWMESVMWGPHHDQWHFERRWDFWHYFAEHGDADMQQTAKELNAYAQRANIGSAPSCKKARLATGWTF